MTITKLILHGYDRLFLNNIDTLTFTPENIVNIIIGANGSGKSSLLYMLNPLPADLTKDFREGGYKYIEISHRNKYYKLSSGMIAKGKHSFICDDVELNHGGTRKVQQELVYEHFKYTIDINNILLGSNNFTTMQPTERKHWFSEMSTIDYKFAVALYNAMRSRNRDIVGAININQKEILTLESKLLTDDKLNKYIKDSEMLEEYINYIVSLYDHNINVSTIDTILSDISNINTITKSVIKNIKYDGTIDNVNKELVKVETYIQQYSNDIKKINEELTKLESTTLDVSDIETAKSKLTNITNNINELIKHKKLNINLDNIENIYNNYISIIGDLTSYLNELSEYIHHDSSKKAIESLYGTKNGILLDIRNLELLIKQFETEINTMKSYKNKDNLIKCVNCNHEWYHHYDDKKLIELETILKDKNIKLSKLQIELETINKNISDTESKLNIVNSIKGILTGNIMLKDIWVDIFSKYNIHNSNPTIIINELNKVIVELEYLKSYTNYIKEKEHLENSIKIFESVNIAESRFIKEKIVSLEKELEDKTNLLIGYKNEYNFYKQQLELKNKLVTLRSSIVSNIVKYKKAIDNEVKVTRNKILSELVNNLKSEMIILKQHINDSKQAINEIQNNYKRIEGYKQKDKVLNILVKELSPSEGIIAKSINSFLNVFIKEVNHIINSVWSYNMSLLPCELSDNNDLDYKFRVKVKNSKIIPDISKLSSSMQEIVNLAFRIVFVKYMGLADTPLILDEFGKTMDPTHSINSYNIIDSVLTSNFNQIFIVSHFENMYGRFANADISVIDPTNLELNRDIVYNKILKLQHY